MIRQLIPTIFGVGLIILGVIVFYIIPKIALTAECGNNLLYEVYSPDSLNKIVIFERNCGATTDFSTHVSLVEASFELENEGGNIFIADDNHMLHRMVQEGGQKLKLSGMIL